MLAGTQLSANYAVIIDFEGFHHKKSGFLIKEHSIKSKNYSDTYYINHRTIFQLTNSEQKILVGFRNIFTVLTGIRVNFRILT